jgi:hypothetical protein
MTLSTELRACARDGIEPSDLHLSEVTELFTTGIWVGGERTMLLLPVRAELSYGIAAGRN